MRFLQSTSIILFLILFFINGITAQDWNFVKEKDDIRIYTRTDENSPVKSFKGETTINTSMDILSDLIENIDNVKSWDEDIKEIELLEYVKDSLIRYYLVYKVPWPFGNRDLYVEASITQDTISGKRVVLAMSRENVIPEKPGLVRIKNYWQKWIMKPAGNGKVHLLLEGTVDPAGAIPAWVTNMVITDTPLKIIKKIREKATL